MYIDKQQSASSPKRQIFPKPLTAMRQLFAGDVPDFVFYAPALILMIVFVFAPILSTFGYAFTIWDGLTTPRWVGLQNFAAIFQDRYIGTAIVNTLKYTTAFVVLNNALAFILALGLDQVRHGKALWRGLYFLPVLLPGVVTALAWKFILNPVYGPLNQILTSLGLDALAQPWLQEPNLATIVIILIGIWQSVGSATVIYLAGLQSVPPELYEAAQMDSANYIQQRRYVTLPMLTPIITINIVQSLIGALRVFDPVWLLTQGNPVGLTDVVATRVYKSAFLEQRFGYGSALSVLLTGVTMVAAFFVLQRMLKREVTE